jgi:thymidylate synthase ThyX
MEFCSLVWDGKKLHVPEPMGRANDDQLIGSDLDNLVELAGRVCYDSLGSTRSRPSPAYHEHIIEVGHGSVWEHANLTFATSPVSATVAGQIAAACVNRPGVFVRCPEAGGVVRITCNLRSIREWFDWPAETDTARMLGRKLQMLALKRAPLVCQGIEPAASEEDFALETVEPETDDELWITMHFRSVSRGFSHELVRHGDWTAISQRSTRFVDESRSPWCFHPLQQKYTADEPALEAKVQNVVATARDAYRALVDHIQDKLKASGVDGFTARKQARGAARGLLGNALETQLIFSASLAQWKRIIAMRAASAADAEIRLVFTEVYDVLSGLYPERFAGFEKRPCADGIGAEVVGPTSARG